MDCERRVVWQNWSRSQQVYPRRVERPTTLVELREIVRDVAARGGRLKPVATGLSFSDILQSDDTLIEVIGLRGEMSTGALLPLEEELWRAPSPVPLVRVACGARIRHLNEALGQAGLAFTNLGGYDNQTLIGAISTSTHGSGVRLGPLSDGVRSLDLVTGEGKLLRLEPTGGITDRAKFERRYADSMQLIQSDELFWPSLVSLGCMGIVHSVTLAVSRRYRLTERRYLRLYSEVEQELELTSGGPLDRFRNYEVTLIPYRLKQRDDYDCLVTERNVASPDSERRPLPNAQRAAESLTFLASTQSALTRVLAGDPRLIPALLRAGIEILATGREPHIDESHLIYNVGKINTVRVVSGEYFFPLHNRAFTKAVRRLLKLVEANANRGVFQPSPLSLRFVAGSRAPLSMSRREPHGAVEIAVFSDLPYAGEALLSYEQLCIELGGRPHWGQMHELTGTADFLGKAYPGLETWLKAYRHFNARGSFNNHFTDRLGISMPGRGS
jgi:L-gulono-1,4-lactone dehydrogenase